MPSSAALLGLMVASVDCWMGGGNWIDKDDPDLVLLLPPATATAAGFISPAADMAVIIFNLQRNLCGIIAHYSITFARYQDKTCDSRVYFLISCNIT